LERREYTGGDYISMGGNGTFGWCRESYIVGTGQDHVVDMLSSLVTMADPEI
jgi:hypothetical protein